jgi:hypothetical protein
VSRYNADYFCTIHECRGLQKKKKEKKEERKKKGPSIVLFLTLTHTHPHTVEGSEITVKFTVVSDMSMGGLQPPASSDLDLGSHSLKPTSVTLTEDTPQRISGDLKFTSPVPVENMSATFTFGSGGYSSVRLFSGRTGFFLIFFPCFV